MSITSIAPRCATTFEIIGMGMAGILLAILLSGNPAPLPRIGIEIRQGIARAMKPGECRPSRPCRNAVYLREGWVDHGSSFKWTGPRCSRYGSTKGQHLPTQVPCLPTR
jgi:hypothetical protein